MGTMVFGSQLKKYSIYRKIDCYLVGLENAFKLYNGKEYASRTGLNSKMIYEVLKDAYENQNAKTCERIINIVNEYGYWQIMDELNCCILLTNIPSEIQVKIDKMYKNFCSKNSKSKQTDGNDITK